MTQAPPLSRQEQALLELGRLLRDGGGYAFVTPTPETHRRVNARPGSDRGADLRDVFGWSRPFARDLLPPEMLRLLDTAGALDEAGGGSGLLKSRVRFSTLGPGLYAHSAYPTTEPDAVFFGPDTYRFVRFLAGVLAMRPPQATNCLVDIGCGSGVGGISAARCLAVPPRRLILADISAKALSFARVNAALNGVEAEAAESDVLDGIGEDAAPDIVVANPPYLVDPAHRLYRDGGGALGFDLSLRILRETLDRQAATAPGGLLILYTGVAIVAGGEDPFRAAAERLLRERRVRWSYSEIDPDVFGEELENPAYAEAERIAAVGLVVESIR
ncbi:MAG TPA: class I SAM-dependent methyltransferase [Stellaceae bacterium]|jgi:methylase of polypeptide subunit release factors